MSRSTVKVKSQVRHFCQIVVDVDVGFTGSHENSYSFGHPRGVYRTEGSVGGTGDSPVSEDIHSRTQERPSVPSLSRRSTLLSVGTGTVPVDIEPILVYRPTRRRPPSVLCYDLTSSPVSGRGRIGTGS